jgi:mannose-1-phosphate guanylyltransferase
MPIKGRPLLEYWLCTLYQNGITDVLVNMHHLYQSVDSYLDRRQFNNWVRGVYEPELLGTAGTLYANVLHLRGHTTLLAHVDNWCQCNFQEFLEFHLNYRPAGTIMTMMTFRTCTPTACGIVEIDDRGVVENFYEKVSDPPNNLANGAVYLLESEVLTWLAERPAVRDFSTEVLPELLGQIATWENTQVHRDIGTIDALLAVQHDSQPDLCWPERDDWMRAFENHPIHNRLSMIGR